MNGVTIGGKNDGVGGRGSGKCGNIISYKYEWAFRFQFFAAGALLNWISHIFWL